MSWQVRVGGRRQRRDLRRAGRIRPELAARGTLYAVGDRGAAYDNARTVPGEEPNVVLALHERSDGIWLVAVGDGATRVQAFCRVVTDPPNHPPCTR